MSKKNMNSVPRFSLRKTTVGMVSAIVAVGLFAGAQTVSANTTNPTETPKTEKTAEIKATEKPIEVTAERTDADKSADAAKQTPVKTEDKKVEAPKANVDSEKNVKSAISVTAKGQDQEDSTIIDLNKSDGKVSADINVQNDKSEDQDVSTVVTLPGFGVTNTLEGTQHTVLDGPVEVTGYAETPDITYWFADTKSYLAPKDFGSHTYSDADAFAIKGKIAAGKDVKINVNLKLENKDEVKKVLDDIVAGKAEYAQNKPESRTYIISVSNHELHSGKRLSYNAYYGHYEIEDTTAQSEINDLIAGNTKWTPNYMIKDATDPEGRHYVMAPKEIADHINKNISKDDISFYDVNGKKTKKLYTDGEYKLQLEKPFNDIKNIGYSVNILPDGTNIWPDYAYSTNFAHRNWHFATNNVGDPEDPAKDKSDLAKWDSPIYLEVQRVFATHDSSFTVNDEWAPEDNLDSAKVYFSKKSDMNYASHHDLKTDPTYHYSYILTDANGKEVLNTAKLGNTDKTKLAAGKYVITYQFEINGNHVVTKPANITVIDDSTPVIPTPTPNPDPEPTQPTDNVQPKPQEPTTPDIPEKPSENETVRPHAQDNDEVKSHKSAKKNVKTAPVKAASVKAEKKAVAKSENTLPQTGENDSMAALALGLVAVTFGLFFSKKREN